MNGVDDFGVVDASQIGGGNSEVRMPKLTLNHHQRNSLPGYLNSVSVPELMRREPTPDPCRGRGVMELRSDPGRTAVTPARGSVQDAEERTDRQALAQLNPWLQLLPGPAVHTNLAALAALPVSNEDRAANRVKVGLGERERFADPEASAPQDDDQRTKPDAAGIIPAARMTEMISSTVGGSGGYRSPLLWGACPWWKLASVAGDRRLPARSSDGAGCMTSSLRT
jgi:hypothetical protein